MKIISKGRKPEEKEYRVTCDDCDTVFEFKKREAQYVSDQRDGDALKIKCPVCNRMVWTVAD